MNLIPLTTEWIPARESKSRKVLVILHGLGDSMTGYADFPETLNLPWLNCLLVNAPDPYYTGYSWYDFAGNPDPGIERSRALLFHLLDKLASDGFAHRDIALFGFSQGCLMTIEVGCRYPHRLAGLVGVSGYAHRPDLLVQGLSPVAREQRFLLTHGTLDPIVPIDAVRDQVQFLRQAGLQIQWQEFVKPHTIIPTVEVDLIRRFLESCR